MLYFIQLVHRYEGCHLFRIASCRKHQNEAVSVGDQFIVLDIACVQYHIAVEVINEITHVVDIDTSCHTELEKTFLADHSVFMEDFDGLSGALFSINGFC